MPEALHRPPAIQTPRTLRSARRRTPPSRLTTHNSFSARLDRSVLLEASHQPHPRLQATVIALDAVASELRCKRATGVGSLEELTTHEGDLHPWQHEYRPPRPSAPRSTSCSRATASC